MTLAAHLIAASLAAAGPVAEPTPERLITAIAAPPTAAPATDQESLPEPAAPVDQTTETMQAAEPPAAPSENFDLEPDLAGLERDPLEGFNRISFGFSQVVDKVIIRPATMVYRRAMPKPGRDGVHNVLSNLSEPLVFVNDLLQLRPDRMIRTLGRFLINSTLGLGGLFDVARRRPYNLPHHTNSFGDTLGYYGVKPGPYIYVPIFGPTTLRDAIGSAEGLLPPMVIGTPFDRKDYQLSTNIADGLDQRERNDDDLKAMLRDAIDPYATFRANFLQNRAGEIALLRARQTDLQTSPAADDPLADPLTDPAVPPPSPPPVPGSVSAPPGQ